jgi:hypothetical protein
MKMANENPKLTITLTGRPPVKITKDEWPIVAQASDTEHDNQHEFQANRKASWKLIVRQHSDGRTIVYGIYDYDTHFQNESGANIRGGEMLTVEGASGDCVGDAEPIIAAIQRVGSGLEDRMPDGPRWSKGYFPRLVHECIADLPAVELS